MSDLQSEVGAGGTTRGNEEVDLFQENGRNGNGRHSGKNGRKIRNTPYGNGLAAPSTIGKNFVVDTNVLLHDPDCITHFADNHVCIPLVVLCELDRFKNEQTERGANARAAHRKLTGLFSAHPELATKGVTTSTGGSVRLVPARPLDSKKQSIADQIATVLRDAESADNRILTSARLVAEQNSAPTILITKDLNLQLKAHALGLPCEDYQNDKVDGSQVEDQKLSVVEIRPNLLQRFASSGTLELPARFPKISSNEYVLLRAGEKRTIPARVGPDGLLHKLRTPDLIRVQRGTPIRPLNLGQQCFLDALLNPDISLVTCYGQAGTGKTLLAVASALHATFNGEFVGVTVSRPVIPLGDTLGFLPGTLEEKLDPWLKPIFDALEFILTPERGPLKKSTTTRGRKGNQRETPALGAGKKLYEPLLESGVVEVEALCYIRGRSIPNRFFILDEAQQLTPLEAKTIVTRMARGSKLVLVGDPAQIDNPYVDRLSNGLVYTRDRLRNEPFSSHISLERGERSDLAEAAAKKM